MRTKTLALSALLGLLGSASVMAQNVYSINAVGYINVTIPPGYSILTVPLICSPDNTLNTILNNTGSVYSGLSVNQFQNGTGFVANDLATGFSSWENGGTMALYPGSAFFLFNAAAPNALNTGSMAATFYGTVPQTGGVYAQLPAGLANSLVAGYNLVGSIVPFAGDLNTGSIPNNFGGGAGPGGSDSVLQYSPAYDASNPPTHQLGYGAPGALATFTFGSWSGGSGPNGDPVTSSVTEGFWYYNANSTYSWTENFSITP